MKRLCLLALLLAALGEAEPAPAPFSPNPFLVDASLVAMPISCPTTTPRAAFDGANYLVVWCGPWYGSQDSIVATRVSQSGTLLDPGGIRIGAGAAPSVACDGSNYLVTWEQDSAIRCARVSAAGAVLDTPTTVTSVHGTAPAVAFNGTDYLIAWGGQDLYAARVSTAGVVIDTGGIVVSAAGGVQEFPSVACDGTNCLIAWRDTRPGDCSGYSDIYGARVAASGAVLDPDGIAISEATFSQYYPAVAFDGANYLVAWQDYRTTDFDIYAARVATSGAVLDPDGLPIATRAIYQRYPSLSFGQGSYLVTWESWDSVSSQGIWGSRVQTSGVPRDTGFCIAPAGTGFAPVAFGAGKYCVSWRQSGIWTVCIDTDGRVQEPVPVYAGANDQRQPSAAFNGSDYLVVWQDERMGDSADIRGIRISQSGARLDPAPVYVCASGKAQSRPAAASDGADFLVAWSDLRDDTADIYAARVSHDGVVLDTSGIVVCNAAGAQTLPAVTYNGADYLVVWQDRRDMACRIYAARVTSGGTVLDPQGFRVCDSASLQQNPGVAFDGANCLVVWSDNRAGTDIFGARIDANGHVLDPTGLMLSPDSLNGSQPAVTYCGNWYFVAWVRSPRSIDGAFVSRAGKVMDTVNSIWNQNAVQRYPAVAYDGTNIAVVWENGSGNDIFGATLSLPRNRLDTFALAAGSGKEYGPKLTAGPFGRILAVYSGWVDTAAGRPWRCQRILGDLTAFGGMAAESPIVPRPLLTAFPNPFNSSLSISLGHLTTGPLDHPSLRIFDAQGRHVRTLVPPPRVPRPTFLSWDATDSRGLPVPSGIYFLRVTSGSMTETRPVTLVRD